MTRGAHVHGPFIATDVSSIAAATKIVHGVGFTSRDIEVWDVQTITLQAKAKGGHASAGGNVEFVIVGSVDDENNFDTEPIATIVLTLVADGAVRKSDPLDVSGLRKIRLASIENKDASYTATLVNLYFGKSCFWI